MDEVDRQWIQRRIAVIPRGNNISYVIAVIVMASIGILAVAAIAILRPEKDNAGLYLTIGGFIATTTASVLGFMKSDDTHKSVNGRLEEFLNASVVAAHASGLAAGRQAGRVAANARTDALAAAASPTPAPAAPSYTAAFAESLSNIDAHTRAIEKNTNPEKG